MDVGEFADKFNDALKKNHCMSFFCNCSVTYSGRAESFLEKGDRIIILKGDGTIIIHQPEKSAPINYMKENTSFELFPKENSIVLKCENLPLKEFLDIDINKIYGFHSYKLDDTEKIHLQGSEEDMAMMIFENPKIVEEGFKPHSREEHTKFGFIDVFGNDAKGNLVIIECKRYTGDLNAVTQLRRYVEKIASSKGVEANTIRGMLACPKITPNALAMLKELGYEFKAIEPPKYLQRHSKDQTKLGTF